MFSAGRAEEPIELTVGESFAGRRLDWYLAQQFPAFSRTRLREAINASEVKVDGRRVKASFQVQPGQRITMVLPKSRPTGAVPEEIALDILYEDQSLAVIHKPPGMVVHPARGHWSGTLASALQYHFDHLSTVGGPARPGIVHRLDRDTSGVIVVAKDDLAHRRLAEQFERREIRKQYFAIVTGNPDRDRDLVDQPIGRHPTQREKMAVLRHPTSRQAVSFYEVQQRFDGFATLRIEPRTGRTHQIRVHLAAIGCPVLCDRAYGGRREISRGEIRRTADATVLLARQALHAQRLGFRHPRTGKAMDFEAPIAEDIARVVDELRRFRSPRAAN